MQVPADAYWGAQTQRAVENFPISGIPMSRRRFIRALGVVKKAAAQANRDLGLIDDDTADAIVAAADEVIAGDHDDQFPVDVFQTGSGTSSNMNANEVIANRAAEIAGAEIGDRVVHPNDHVNYGQSSNVIPTAMHVAALEAVEKDLVPALETLHTELEAKETEFDGVVKTGRTHLQDATPIRLGQEFSGYRTQTAKGIERAETVQSNLRELALGRHRRRHRAQHAPRLPRARRRVHLRRDRHRVPRPADNHFEAQAAHDAMAEAHGALRTIAGSLNKMGQRPASARLGPAKRPRRDRTAREPARLLDHARQNQPGRRRVGQSGPQAGRRQRRRDLRRARAARST